MVKKIKIKETKNLLKIICKRYECELILFVNEDINVYIKLNTVNYDDEMLFSLYDSNNKISDLEKYKEQLSKWCQFMITQSILIPYAWESSLFGYHISWERIMLQNIQLETVNMDKWINECFNGLPIFRWSGADGKEIFDDIKENYDSYINDEYIMNDNECLECIHAYENKIKEETIEKLYKTVPKKLKKCFDAMNFDSLDEKIKILTQMKNRENIEDILNRYAITEQKSKTNEDNNTTTKETFEFSVNDNLIENINFVFNELQIPINTKSSNYLREIIILIHNDESILNRTMTDIFNIVADKYDTSAEAIRRGLYRIRNIAHKNHSYLYEHMFSENIPSYKTLFEKIIEEIIENENLNIFAKDIFDIVDI